MMQKIKNIIFDLGGVLVDLNEQSCIEAFEAIHAPTVGDYVRDHRTEDLFYDIEIGHTTTAEFCREVRRITAVPATDAEIVGAWNALLTTIADEKKQRLLSLRRDYRLFLLSNTNDMHWRLCADHLFNYGPWRADDMFERIYLSYRLHLAKPDPAIFSYVLADAGLQADETLFIDDNADNCRAAQSLGIHTLLQSAANDWMQRL